MYKLSKDIVRGIYNVLEGLKLDVIDIDTAQENLINLFEIEINLSGQTPEVKVAPDIMDVLKAVLDDYGLTFADISTRSRRHEVVEPRMIVMYLTYNFCDREKYTLSKIGTIFSRDHTTVLNAVHTVQDRIDTEQDFKLRVNRNKRKMFQIANIHLLNEIK